MYKLPEQLKKTLEQVIRSSSHPNVPFNDVLNVVSQLQALQKIDVEANEGEDEAEDGDE